MSQPQHPERFYPEGPNNACIIAGKALGWTICTSLGFAHGLNKCTYGRIDLDGCDIRRRTGDTVGGTTIEQNAKVAESLGVHVAVRTGTRVLTYERLATYLQSGRGCGVAGNAGVLVHGGQGKWRSTAGKVNHHIYINHVRGGTDGHPAEAFVYDPAANGRTTAWGKAAQGPSWWPWALVQAFCAALQPWGDNDPRLLGVNRVYTAIFPDTEPHVHLRFGGKRTPTFPDRQRANFPLVALHNRLTTGKTSTVRSVRNGTLLIAFQEATATTAAGEYMGSRLWYGDHDGVLWWHSKRVRHAGGPS